MVSEISAEKDIIVCFKCGTQAGLFMLAHRKANHIVGWIFVCKECFPELCGKGLVVILVDESEEDGAGEQRSKANRKETINA